MDLRTTAGPTGFGWVRSLLAFGHRNPAARLVSAVVASAIATLLVFGTGAAYADDAAQPDPAATAGAGDTGGAAASDDATPAADDSAPADDATPSADAAPAGDSAAAADGGSAANDADAAAPETASGASGSSGPMMTTLTKLAAPNAAPNAAPVDVTVPCDYQDPGFAIVSGFEIDGNLCLDGDPTNGTEDWDSVDFSSDAADTVNDGFDDATTFTNGDSENNDPSTWHVDGPTPNGKSDIGTAYAYSKMSGGDVFGYFAFTNTSTAGGTQQYDVEYNQNEATENANGATVPVREPGDLLFRFSSIGSAPMVFSDAKIYRLAADFGSDDCFAITGSDPAGGWCTLDIPPGSFKSAASDDGLFQEGSIEISAFFGEGDCSGLFGTTQIRSVTGNSFATSALKDFVFPLDVTTPSTCGSLRIEKDDADSGDPAVGGVYQIDGDPRAGADPTATLCVYDGPASDLATLQAAHPELATECDTLIADGTSDGSVDVIDVEPGTYTVTEVVPPPGYLLNPEPNPGNSDQVTVGDGTSETVTFANHRQWAPLDISKTADGTFTALYLWDIDKQIAPTADGPWSDGTTPGAPLVKTAPAGGDTGLYYRVVVTEDGVQTSNYVVAGTIHVDNPNDDPVDASIDESLTGCTLDSNDAAFPVDVTVPSGGADYAYTCDLGDGPVDPGTNTATVTWDRSTYPQTTDDLTDTGNFTDSAEDAFTFAETESINQTITVEDDHVTFDPVWTITFGEDNQPTEVDGDPVGVYSSAVYSNVVTRPAAGTCSAVLTNTASVLGDGDAILVQDSESGRVCSPAVAPPVVSPPLVEPPAALPNTGGPNAWLLAAGLVLLLGGGTLVAGGRLRRRRS